MTAAEARNLRPGDVVVPVAGEGAGMAFVVAWNAAGGENRPLVVRTERVEDPKRWALVMRADTRQTAVQLVAAEGWKIDEAATPDDPAGWVARFAQLVGKLVTFGDWDGTPYRRVLATIAALARRAIEQSEERARDRREGAREPVASPGVETAPGRGARSFRQPPGGRS
jgi:hypothetical protein